MLDSALQVDHVRTLSWVLLRWILGLLGLLRLLILLLVLIVGSWGRQILALLKENSTCECGCG